MIYLRMTHQLNYVKDVIVPCF